MSHHPTSIRWALLAIFGAAAPAHAVARDADAYATVRAELHPGQTTASIVSVSDPDQSYAVHLPSNYDSDRKWPVLLLIHPRGRAMLPVERYRDVAERRGYVLVSSYNTASDTGEDLNSPAVKAMITDTPQLVSVEEKRYYLVGFSGTARTAWAFAKMYADDVAGIVAFGGGLPLGHSAPWDATYAHYGAAGVFDFNYDEMIRLDGNLELRNMAHTFESFWGGHQWGPVELCERSVDWMELQAMKSGLRSIDRALVREIYAGRLAYVDSLTREKPHAAHLRAAATVADFEGLLEETEMSALKVAVAVLGSDPAVRRAMKAQTESVERYYRYKKRFADLLDAVESGTSSREAAPMIEALEIDALKKQADAPTEEEADAIRAHSARRLLEVVYVQCTFYLPRDYVRDGRAWAAVLALEVADAVRPLNLVTFLDRNGLGSLREESTFGEWMERRARR